MSVPVVVNLTMLNLWDCLGRFEVTALLLARHVANEYGGWVKIVIQFTLFHKPREMATIERGLQYNEQQLLYSTLSFCLKVFSYTWFS